jgi:hypothetical protein
MHAFEYLKPKSIDEAISLMESLVASLRPRPSSMPSTMPSQSGSTIFRLLRRKY